MLLPRDVLPGTFPVAALAALLIPAAEVLAQEDPTRPIPPLELASGEPVAFPAATESSEACQAHSAPFFRGTGGFVVEPSDGRSAELTVRSDDNSNTRTVFAGRNGLAVELLASDLCMSGGSAAECQVTFSGIRGGGWYWVNGDRNAAVAPLVCDGGLSGTPALEPRGVAASRAAFGTGSLFVHNTQRLMGIVPHLSVAAADGRRVEVRISVFGGGTVDVVGDGQLECVGTATCVGWFDAAGSVTLRASPPAEYDFDRWQGCDNVDESDCTVALHEDRLVFLSFKRPLTLRDHVVQFDRNRLDDIRQHDPSSGLMVLGADAKADDIEIGSVLVSSVVEPGLALKSPFLRRVTDMQEFAGSSTYVKTTPATLEDLIESGTLAVNLPVGSEATSASALLPQILPDGDPGADLAVRAASQTSSPFEWGLCRIVPKATVKK